jgi:hypothetical protein
MIKRRQDIKGIYYYYINYYHLWRNSVRVREFKDKISKGLGSAILFLKNNPDQAHRYYNAILLACCHDTRYDSQCESVRSEYLYEAISLSNRKQQLEDDLLKRLCSAKRYWDVTQLFNLAEIIYDNGNIRAREIMYSRFKDYLYDIQRI